MSVGLTDKAWLDLLNAEKARAEKAEANAEKWARIEAAGVERGIRADADALSEIQGLQAAYANANARAACLNALRLKQDEELVSAREALAAARRECDLWKQIAGDLYAPLEERDMHMCSASGPGDVHANVCGTFGATNCPVCLVAALAAPAASVECPECNQPAPIDADGKIGPHRLGGAPCANGWPDRKEKSNG